MKSFLLTLACCVFPLLCFSQDIEMLLDFDGMMAPEDLEQVNEVGAMQIMCTTMPGLTILNCEADNRDAMPPDAVPAGTIRWRVEGGLNPITCRLISAAGPIYNIVGGGGPGGNEYNSPRNFSVTNTTTAQTCIVMGDYTIEVTDAEGCIRTCMVTFVPECFDYASGVNPIVTDATCGSATGCIDLGNIPDAYCPDDPNGGSVNYSWSHGGPNSPSICGLTPGSYSVTMSDFYGCQGIVSNIMVGSTSGVGIDNCGSESPTLIGGNDGSIFFNVNGGTPPFTVTWSGDGSGSAPANQGTNNISGFMEGNYVITVTDAQGCTAMCNVFVENPSCSLMATCPTGPNPDNTVTFSMSGGVAPYTVNYSGPTTGGGLAPGGNYTSPVLSSGNYTFVLRDANGVTCQIVCPITIFVPDCSTLAVSNTDITNVDCAGSLTGGIDITLSGGYPAFTYDWSGPDGFTASTQDISGLAAGTYTLDVSDTQGCGLMDLMFTVTQPDSLMISCAALASDFGQDNGSVSVDITGGTGPFELDLNGVLFPGYVSGSSIGSLAPGNYDIIITDANGCTQSCMVTIIEVQCDISYVLTAVDPSCPGAADGSISLVISDAAGDSTIVWSVPGNDNATMIDGLMAGTYMVTVGDTACTLATETIVLNDPPTLSIDLNQVAAIQCHGDSTAALAGTLTNGVAPFTFNWNTPLVGDTLNASGLPAGTYQVTVTDDNGCTAADTLTVTQPEDLVFGCAATGESASGANDGTITLDFAGAAPFTISNDLDSMNLQLADSPIVLTGQSPGTYNYTLTDANGCTETCTVVVDPGGCVMTVDVALVQPDCPNPNSGSLTANQTGGTGPFVYTWTLPDNSTLTGPMISGQPAGPYSLLVTDALGCSATSEDTLVAFTAFPDLAVAQPDSICAASCISFDLQLTGQTPFQVDYELVDSGGNTDFTGSIDVFTTNDTTVTLCPTDFPFPGMASLDDYTIRFTNVTDGSCATALDFGILVNPFPLATDTIRQTHCDGEVVTIEGQDFDMNTPDGEINLPGQSVNGCDSLLVVDLTFVSSVTGNVMETLCPGDSLVLEGNVFNAANPTGSFVSATNSSIGCDSIVQVDISFYAPAAGTFAPTLCLTDTVTIGGVDFHSNNPTGDVVLANASVNGCDSTVSVDLTFFAPAIGNLDTILCTTDSIVVDGQVFDFDNPLGLIDYPGQSVNGCDSVLLIVVDFFPLSTGTFDTTICATGQYVFQGTIFDVNNPTGDVVLNGASVNGCDSTVTVTVDFFAPATGTFDTTICATGQYVFQGTTFDVNNPTGDVVLNGASANGCDSTVTVTVDFFAPATGTFDTTICATGQFVFQGTTFDVSNPTGDVVLNGASVNGCDSTVTVTVDFFAPATGTFDTTICATGQFVFQGTTFDVNNPTGDVVLNGASINGCDSTVTVTVDFFAPATGTFDTTICATGQYVFQGTTFDVDNPTGDVVLNGASANGCDSTVTVTVDFFAPAIGTFDTIICPGESILLGGQLFDADNPTGDITLANASVNGCDSLVSVSVSFSEPLLISLTGISGNCADTEFTLTFDYNGTGDLSLLLSNTVQGSFALTEGSNSLVVTPAGGTAISLIGASANGETCALDFGGTVAIPEAPVLSLEVLSGDGTNGVSCFGGNDGRIRATLMGDDIIDYTFSWSNGATGAEVADLPAGTYTVTATHPDGCTVSQSVTLGEPLPLLFTASTLEGDCFGNQPGVQLDTIDGGSGGPYLYRFDQGAFAPVGSFPVVLRNAPGPTRLEIQDVNGCLESAEFTLLPPPVGVVAISPQDPVIRLGDSVLLSAQTNLNPILTSWSPGAIDTAATELQLRYFVSPTENTTYTLVVVDSMGCSATAEVMVRVDRRVPVFAPNGFSPNGDGVNDVFTFFGELGVLSFQDFRVVTRWGETVYEAVGELPPNNPNWGWDGTHRGEPLNPGVYVYQVYVNLADGRKELLSGEITLLR